MNLTLKEYVAHIAKHAKVYWIDNIPWYETGRRLTPLAMPHMMKPVHPDRVRKTAREAKALIAMWTDAWDTPPCDWWWICCDDKHYDVETLPKRARRDIRAGLRRCTVRQLESEWFAENGYEVYAAAHAQYEAGPPITNAKEFTEEFLKNAEYPGRETWGAFVEGELTAYASCIVIEDAVHLSSAKSHPDHRKAMPNNALIYTLTQHYLRERGSSFVTGGTKGLLHPTNFQHFLERMGYRRIYCPLRSVVSPALALAAGTGVGIWSKYLGLDRIMPGPMSKLRAVGSLVKITKACEGVDTQASESPAQTG
jgi:hypothetical protein